MSAADLAQALAYEDPEMAAALSPNDSQRLARALEVIRATGRSLRSFHGPQSDGLRAGTQIVATRLLPDRAALYATCDQRLDRMIASGALDEVKALAARRLSPELPVMKAVGVPELLGVVQEEADLPTALAAAKLSTRHYAKRQYTWFRNQCADWHVNLDLDQLAIILRNMGLTLK
jgi:tRNA dimethylallyltransferase